MFFRRYEASLCFGLGRLDASGLTQALSQRVSEGPGAGQLRNRTPRTPPRSVRLSALSVLIARIRSVIITGGAMAFAETWAPGG